MARRDFLLHVGLPKCASTALQQYFWSNAVQLKKKGFYYPDPQNKHGIPKHQYLVKDLLQGNFDSKKFESEDCENRTTVLSAEGLTNHFYDFPKDGLAKVRNYFLPKQAVGLMLIRKADTWLRSYYAQCILNPVVHIAPHYGTDLRLDDFKNLPQVKRISNFEKLAEDVRRTYGLKEMLFVQQEDDILKQLQDLGFPDLERPLSRSENASPAPFVIEIVRQINELANEEEIRSCALSYLQKWAKTDNFIMKSYTNRSFDPLVCDRSIRLLQEVKPVKGAELSVDRNQIESLKASLPVAAFNSSRRFKFDKKEEEDLEFEVGPAGFWEVTQNFQFEFLRSRGLKPEKTLLDIGCGVLRGGLPLIHYLEADKYTGIDVRSTAIQRAQELVNQFQMSHKNPTLTTSECFGKSIVPPKSQNFVFAFQLLYHLTDELVFEFFEACKKTLSDDGVIFANVHAINLDHRSKWKEFPFVPRPVEFYRDCAGDAGFNCLNLGQMLDLGYPEKLGGHKNEMLKFETKMPIQARGLKREVFTNRFAD